MLGSSSTAAATLSTSTSSATPTSPTRPGRLRGLSYLRNYTHLHHTPRNPSAPLNRAHTSPAGSSPTSANRNPLSRSEREGTAPSPQRSNSTKGGNTSGWVPTVGGQSGISRVATSPQPSNPDFTTGNASMTRNRAETYADRGSDRLGTDNAFPDSRRSMSADGINGTGAVGADKKSPMPTIRLIPHHEARATRPSLTFPIINRTLPTHDSVIRVGRYSERDNQAALQGNGANTVIPVGFKSKVVSRRHCEFWCQNNQWYVKDVKSSSGTFLNHVRLSGAGSESRPYPVNDGDIVQLGIDFKGGEEVIFRCVKIRVECNRSWQKGLNQFNTSTHKRLRNLASASKDSDTASVNSSECSICLNPVSPCQALFVAPCSHVWHYKCIRTLIYPEWPSFQCPNCRAYADLEADVDVQEPDSEAELSEALRASEADALPHSNTRNTLTAGASDDDEEISAALNYASISSNNRSEPVAVPARTSGSQTEGRDPIGARSATPTSTTQFALAATMMNGPEGPTTPRNDAGPFVLDSAIGGAQQGRPSIGRRPVPERDGGEEDVGRSLGVD